MFFKISQILQENACVRWSLFLIKMQAWRLATLFKRDSDRGVFLWNLRYLSDKLFFGTPPMAASDYTINSFIHRVPVPRWGLLDSPGKISNLKKFSGVRPSIKFLTRDITKPAGENVKILRGEPHKHTVLNQKITHISHIYLSHLTSIS